MCFCVRDFVISLESLEMRRIGSQRMEDEKELKGQG